MLADEFVVQAIYTRAAKEIQMMIADLALY
jgi:hypothetical protein